MKKRTVITAAVALLSVSAHAAAARVIAHQGEWRDIKGPGNTMASFRAAIEGGADGLELDIHLTKDNEIICLHDPTTKGPTQGVADLTVKDATLAELRALDVGCWSEKFKGERIPTLAEALTLAHDGFEIYVELKCGVEVLPRLAEVIAAEPKATPERVLFWCFNDQVVKALREKFPAYRAYWLVGTGPGKDGAPGPTAEALIAKAKACNASGLAASVSADITPAFVSAVRAAGLSVHIWTVNDPARFREIAEMGVDSITSDYAVKYKLSLRDKGN